MNFSSRSLLALSLVTSVASATLLAACGIGHSCTEIGCVDGFWLDLQAPAGGWPAGDYTLSLTVDGKAIDCTTTLPFVGNETVKCSSTEAQVDISAEPQAPEKHAITNILFPTNPKKVKVVIARDGTELVSKDFTPTYTPFAPNGADCPGTCIAAGASLKVP